MRRPPATGSSVRSATTCRGISSPSRRTSRRRAHSASSHDNVLPMWDWVGGRYSLWSAVGLPIAIGCGYRRFEALLAGAAAMDKHVRTDAARPQSRRCILGARRLVECALARTSRSASSFPYAHALARSAGVSAAAVARKQRQASHAATACRCKATSAPALWGGTGTDAQHSFFQWLHQGTHPVPVEFVVPVRARASARRTSRRCWSPTHSRRRRRCWSGARPNRCGASSRPRACRRARSTCSLLRASVRATAPRRRCCCRRSTRGSLGALLALYEHRTYVESLLLAGECVRPVGRRARQDAGEADRRRARRRRAAADRHRRVDRGARDARPHGSRKCG